MNTSRKRVLITGASGLVGTKLVEAAGQYGGDFLLTSRNKIDNQAFSWFPFDFSHTDQIHSFLSGLQPEVIIHTAAVTSVDYATDHAGETELINVAAVESIARWCRISHCRFVHFSTDFVFDGKHGMYSETDLPSPISIYGESKWKSEQLVQSLLDDYVIIRTVLVYGYAHSLPRLNFPLWIISRLSEGLQTSVTADQFRTPTLAEDLAKATLNLAFGNHTGIYHIAGPEYMSVFDFAIKTAEVFSLDVSLLTPVATHVMNQTGPRPLKTGFDIKKAKHDIGFTPRGVKGGLEQLLHQKKKDMQNTDSYI